MIMNFKVIDFGRFINIKLGRSDQHVFEQIDLRVPNDSEPQKDNLRRTNNPIRRTKKPLRRTNNPLRRTNKPLRRTNNPLRRTNQPLWRSNNSLQRTNKPLEDQQTFGGPTNLWRTNNPLRRINKPLWRTQNQALMRKDQPQCVKAVVVHRQNNSSIIVDVNCVSNNMHLGLCLHDHISSVRTPIRRSNICQTM